MHNLLDPALLFFVIGAFAGAIRSNLEIPAAISRFLSLYLLMALGLKGGFALSASGLTANVGWSLAAAVTLALTIPLLGYMLLRRIVSGFDAAAIAATYMIRHGQYKYVHYVGMPPMLYDLAADPEELARLEGVASVSSSAPLCPLVERQGHPGPGGRHPRVRRRFRRPRAVEQHAHQRRPERLRARLRRP